MVHVLFKGLMHFHCLLFCYASSFPADATEIETLNLYFFFLLSFLHSKFSCEAALRFLRRKERWGLACGGANMRVSGATLFCSVAEISLTVGGTEAIQPHSHNVRHSVHMECVTSTSPSWINDDLSPPNSKRGLLMYGYDI